MSTVESPFLPQEEAAAFLHLSPRTLERFRVDGSGPVYCKLGRRVVYSRADLIAWAEHHRIERTDGRRRHRRR